jgi:hypothetical protein
MLATRDAEGSYLVLRLGRRDSNRVGDKGGTVDDATLAEY